MSLLRTTFCASLLALGGTALPADAEPHPRLIVTPERRAVWARMRADFEAHPDQPRTTGGVWF